MTQYIGPAFRYFGAPAVACLSFVLPNGAKEIMLGRHLCLSKGVDPLLDRSLSFVFGPSYQQITSPRFTWLQGHLYDLINKVLVAVYGYLTLPKISATLTTVLVAKNVLQDTPAPRLKLGLCTLGHVFVWAPAIFKMLHMVLDYCNLPSEKRVYELGQITESFLFVAPHLAALALLPLSGSAIRPLLKSIGYGTLFFGLIAGAMSVKIAPPHLIELAKLFKGTEIWHQDSTGEIKTLDLQTALDTLYKLRNQLARFSISIADECYSEIFPRVRDLLNGYLDTQVYTPLYAKNFTILNEEESELRALFGYKGPAEAVYIDRDKREIEHYRFATALLCANLHRLKAKERELLPEQFKRIQYGLFFQAAYDLQDGKLTSSDPSVLIKIAPDLTTLTVGIEAELKMQFSSSSEKTELNAFVDGIHRDQWHTQKRLSFTQIYDAAVAFKPSSVATL